MRDHSGVKRSAARRQLDEIRFSVHPLRVIFEDLVHVTEATGSSAELCLHVRVGDAFAWNG